MMEEKEHCHDACQWTYNRYIKGDVESLEFLKNLKVQADLAGQIYDIRNKLRMTRKDLADFSGLTPEIIEDLEESDYDGDWLEAVSLTNRAFERWIKEIVIPAAQMKPDEYLIKVVGV
jgi:hypothetical protein